jgi:hypothetical protein
MNEYFPICANMTETQFHRHGKDLAKTFDLSKFDGIVCVSGDGVLVEVCTLAFLFLLGEPFSTLKFREQHVLAVNF